MVLTLSPGRSIGRSPGRIPGAKRPSLEDNFGGISLDTGLWLPTDTESKISQSGGELVCAGGYAVPSQLAPSLIDVIALQRAAGLTIDVSLKANTASQYGPRPFLSSVNPPTDFGAQCEYLIQPYDGGMLSIGRFSTDLRTPFVYSADTWLYVRMVVLATGAIYYVSTDRVAWKIIGKHDTGTTALLYLILHTYNGAGNMSDAKVYRSSVPTPVVNISQAITPSLGSELVVNGNFAAWTADDPDSWTVFGEAAGNEVSQVGTGLGHGGGGTGLANLYTTGAQIGIRQANCVTGTWYQGVVDIDTVVSGQLKLSNYTLSYYSPALNSTGTKTAVFRAENTTFAIQADAATDITIDNMSCKPLTTSSLVGTLQTARKEGIFERNVTVAANYQAGFWMNWDGNTDGTEDYVEALVDRAAGTARLSKCVNGTITNNVITAAITYSAGATLRVVRVGTSYALYYNNAQVGTTQTISDAGITDNTGFAAFQTDPSASGNIVCYGGINVN